MIKKWPVSFDLLWVSHNLLIKHKTDNESRFYWEKKQYLSEKKNSRRGFHLKKKFLHKQWAKKKFVQPDNSPPPSPPPITFLMVRP